MGMTAPRGSRTGGARDPVGSLADQARNRSSGARRNREGGADSNWDRLGQLVSLGSLGSALGGLGVMGWETARGVAEMPGTLAAKGLGSALGMSDQEIAGRLRGGPGQWIANEELFDPVYQGGPTKRDRLNEVFPLLGHGVTSYQNTARRVQPQNWHEYVDAYRTNTLPDVIMEDVLNVTSLATPGARALKGTGAAATTGGTIAANARAARPGLAGTIAAADNAVVGKLAARPALAGRVAEQAGRVEKWSTFGERGAFLPAAPYRLAARGVRAGTGAGRGALEAVEAAGRAGTRAPASTRALAAVGRADRRVRSLADDLLIGERTAPLRDMVFEQAARGNALLEGGVRSYKVADDIAGADGPVALFVGSGQAEAIAPTWAALSDEARQQTFQTLRAENPVDLTYDQFVRGMDYRTGVLDAGSASKIDAAVGELYRSSEFRSSMYAAGEGRQVYDPDTGRIIERPPEQTAYALLNAEGTDLGPWIEQKHMRDAAAGIARQEKRAAKAQQVFDNTDAPVRPDGEAPAPNLRMKGMHEAHRSLITSDIRAGRLEQQAQKLYDDGVAQIDAETAPVARRAHLRDNYVDHMDDPKWAEGKLDPDEIVDATRMAREVTREAESAAGAALADLDLMIEGSVPYAHEAWRRKAGNKVKKVGGNKTRREGTGRTGADWFEGMTDADAALWNRYSNGVTTATGKVVTNQLDQIAEWVGQNTNRVVSVDEAANMVLDAMRAVDDLERIAQGRLPRYNGWASYLPEEYASIVDALPDGKKIGVAKARRMFDQDVTYTRGADGKIKWTGSRELRRVAQAVGRAARRDASRFVDDALDTPSTFGRNLDEAAATFRDVAVEDAYRAFTDDFVVGERTSRYADLSPGQKKLYRAFERQSRAHKGKYRTEKARRRFVESQQRVIDQARRNASSQRRAGQAEGARFQREQYRYRTLERAAEGEQKALSKMVADRDEALAAELDSVLRVPADYRPAMVMAERWKESLGKTADELEAKGEVIEAAKVRDAADKVASSALDTIARAEQIATAGGERPVMLLGGKLSEGSTGLSPVRGGTPKVRALDRQAKRGEVTPMSPQGQAILIAEQSHKLLRNETAFRVQNEMAATAAQILDDLDLTDMRGGQIADEVKARVAASDQHPTIPGLPSYELVPWDPASMFDSMPVDQITADTMWVPKPLLKAFRDQFADAEKFHERAAAALRKGNQGWKDLVLFSPQWHMGNIISNVLLAATAADINIVDYMREYRQEWKRFAPEPDPVLASRPGRISQARYRRQQRQYAEGQRLNQERVTLPREQLDEASGLNSDLSRWTRDVKVVDPDRGTVAMNVAPKGELRRRAGRARDWNYSIGERTDDAARAAIYTAKVKGGMAPDDALKLAIKSMPDARMRPWEQRHMKAVFPFYLWLSHITKVSARLARDHPMRVAWIMRLEEEFTPDSYPEDIPMLEGGMQLGPELFFGGQFLNPYGDMVAMGGPSAMLGNVSPILKLGAEAATGTTPTEYGMEVLSTPPGMGGVSAYGSEKPKPIWNDPGTLLYRALGNTRQTRVLRDIGSNVLEGRPALQATARYDTGEPVKRRATRGGRGRVVVNEQWGGPAAIGARFLGVPFPREVDVEGLYRSRDEKREALARRRESYLR